MSDPVQQVRFCCEIFLNPKHFILIEFRDGQVWLYSSSHRGGVTEKNKSVLAWLGVGFVTK